MKNVHTIALLAAGILAQGHHVALAAVSADEAKQLGTTLTEYGAEKAASKDGTIPAYNGGLEKLPAYDPKTMKTYIDPFAGEKPLYTVDANNMAQHESELTAGTKAMMKRHPTFKLNVYPSHRTFRYSQSALQNSVKNATTAKLTGEIEGDAITGADKDNLPFAGIPFPIPKTGYEVLWNTHFRFSAAVSHNVGTGYLVDAAGGVATLAGVDEWFVHPWYDTKGTLRAKTFDAMFGFSATLTSPPSSAGIVFLNYYTPNAAEGGQRVWFYTPGQRRVRLAPEFAYDVPIASYGGVTVWDDIYGYLGRMDRFNYKITGKKELLVPYNAFGPTNTAPIDTILGPKHVNPATVRWEKHRIWVVDGTRKPNARHVYSRRTFYVDEDCWCIVSSEAYDSAGALWRVSDYYTFPTYDTGGFNIDTWSTNDLIKGDYFILNSAHTEKGNSIHSYSTAEGLPIHLTAQAVAAASVR